MTGGEFLHQISNFKFSAKIMLCRVSYIIVHSTYLLFSVKSQFVINAERDFSVYYTV